MPTLDWIGKDKVVNHHLEVPYRVLERQYSYDESGQHLKDNGSENMIIHGDNLSALKSLLPQYEARINCIYIDPPYNTGNEHWIYNDNVNDPRIQKWLGKIVGTESEDLSRHDKWLCMMYPRLKLLHKLLAEDGVIFISIDDNEQANLKLICDEIFGSRNYISSIPWQSRQSLQNDTDLSINHEYVICYAKKRRMIDRRLKRKNVNRWYDIKEFAFYPIPIDNSKYSNPDNDPRGQWKADPFDAPNVRPNLTYPVINPNTGVQYLPPKGRCWRILPEKYSEALKDGRIIFGKNGKGRPQLKVFLNEQQDFGSVPNSWFKAEICGTATHGTKELQKILGKGKFETPKPTSLIEEILKISVDKNAIVLDSFAGSGTTAHAILNMNKADGGNRKFILIEMMDYADSITAERIKRVIKGYDDGTKKIDGIGGNFSFYESGEMLMNGNILNKDIETDKIREYVYFSETKSQMPNSKEDEPYYLGTHFSTVYYFCYEHNRTTILNRDFLHTVKTRADKYVIYADLCTLSNSELEKYHITFKKISRDIQKL